MMVDDLNMFEDELEHEPVIDFDVYIKPVPTLRITIKIKKERKGYFNNDKNHIHSLIQLNLFLVMLQLNLRNVDSPFLQAENK
jgi:hypothetical protein